MFLSSRDLAAPVADFDSASGMVRALARFLRGQDFRRLGLDDPITRLIPVANAFPLSLRRQLYTWSGWMEAIGRDDVGAIRAEALSTWAVRRYEAGRRPAVAIGSSNGALTHLWGALGVPWLPQTFLVPVRRHLNPDDAAEDLEWGREPGRRLLERNPELQLHHMHDPNQDRLMVTEIGYFRVKRRTLGEAYRRFIEETLQPGGTIFLVECERRWPVVTVGERHYFQPGAMGGASPQEYLDGGPRVAAFLERAGSYRRGWPNGPADDERPEAEWGFEPALRASVLDLAERRGYRVRRVRFVEPEDPSPWVAELFRWWYRRRRLPAGRLLVESFLLLEPWWALRTGSLPYWALFGTQPSLERLEAYLDAVPEFREIYAFLFPHGVEAVGTAPAAAWRKRVLGRARERGRFVGLDEGAWPADFAHLARYHDALPGTIGGRQPMPDPLTLDDLEAWLDDEASGRWAVGVEEATAAASPAMVGAADDG